MDDRKHNDNLQVLFLRPKPSKNQGRVTLDGGFGDLPTALTRRGMRVFWLGLSPKVLNPLRNWNPFIAAIDLFRAVRVMLRYRNVNVVVSIFESGGLVILLLRRLLFFRPAVFLWDASVSNDWRVVRWIQKLAFPRYDGFLMLTQSQLEEIEQKCKPNALLWRIGYNMDDDFIQIANRLAETPSDEGYVLAVGDDVTRDYGTLISAATDWPVVIKSNWRPPSQEDPCDVRFISARLPVEEYASLIHHARMVVIPLHHTSHPGGITTLYEAMAMGKPVVVSDSPIAAEVVSEFNTGLVVPVHDVEALHGAIRELWEDSQRRESLGAMGREFIEEHGTADRLASNILEAVLDYTDREA